MLRMEGVGGRHICSQELGQSSTQQALQAPIRKASYHTASLQVREDTPTVLPETQWRLLGNMGDGMC